MKKKKHFDVHTVIVVGGAGGGNGDVNDAVNFYNCVISCKKN